MIDHPVAGTVRVPQELSMMQAYRQSLFALRQMHGLIGLHTWYQG
jgi:hypothetical protein